jgi:caa(3)-type oxidase subunit IV
MSEHSEHNAHSAHHSDTVTLPVVGTVTVYGGMYTVVFGVLAVLTAIEVLLAELFKGVEGEAANTFRILALFGIGVLKAILVVWFYMHLRSDNPIFRIILLVPLVVVIISVFYLLGVPTGEGLGYR